MNIRKFSFKSLVRLRYVLFFILTSIAFYGLYLLTDNSNNYNLKVSEKVTISSTIISDKEFLDTVKFGSVKNVKNMLEVGANPNAIDENGRNAMSIAASFSNNNQIVKVLKDYKVDINHKDVNGYTPLMFSIIANNSSNFLDVLIDNKADVNAINNSGASILMIALALCGDNLKLIEKLLNSGADVNYKDPHNVTPLMVALRNSKKPQVIELLLQKGAKPNVKDDLGISSGDILRSNSNLSKYPNLLKKIPN